jgi:hypothetical protein
MSEEFTLKELRTYCAAIYFNQRIFVSYTRVM